MKRNASAMTPGTFRKMALGIPGAIESAHMNHPDFRLEGRIFATLGPPDDASWGMVKLTREQQRSFMEKAPRVFSPCSGAWGERGATKIHLQTAEKSLVRAALNAASKNVTAKPKGRTARGAVG
jgi:hypothetical protein